MKQLFLFVLLFALVGGALFFSFSTSSFAETSYTTLAPITGFVDKTVTINSDSDNLGKYLNDMFRMGIALCTGLAILMIIVGGVQYVSSDAWSKKTDGKERIYNAILGLLIVLGSVVLLNTIDPRLLSTKLSLERVELEEIYSQLQPEQKEYVNSGNVPPSSPSNPSSPTNPSTPGQPGSTPSGTYGNIPSEINNQASGKTLDSSLLPGLQNMNTELKAAGINWTITEAYPPSRAHKNPCHQNGTCVDADFLGNDSADNIKKFIDVANNNGFKAVWEVKTQTEKDNLIAAGVPSDRVMALGNWISGSHFSVYNKK